jgi:hypothetical protein
VAPTPRGRIGTYRILVFFWYKNEHRLC